MSHRPEPRSKIGDDPPAPRPSFGTAIKQLFGTAAEFITGKPTPALAAQRKRRQEETGKAFKLARNLAQKVKRILRQPVARSLADHLYAPRPYDPAAERGYAEQVLREQMDEWSQEEQQEEESFHYGSAAGFDPQP